MRAVRLGRASRGLTLIELMVTIAVATILLAAAAPSFQKLVAAQRMRAASYELLSHLVLARSEALKRSAPVEVRPLTGGWRAGWQVIATGVAEPLARHDGIGDVQVTTAPASVVFDLNGRVADAVDTVRIGLSDGATRARCISLDPMGRPRATAKVCP